MDEVEVFVLVGNEEIALEQSRYDLVRGAGNGHTDGVLESCALQALDLGRHGCREEVGVATISGEHAQDLVEDGAEVKVKQAIGFVENHVFQVLEGEALCVLKMIQETSCTGQYNAIDLHREASLAVPGVATTMCGRLDSAIAWGTMSMPPTSVAHLTLMMLPSASTC